MGLFSRIFRSRGALPEPVRARVTADGILLLEEGVGGTVTYRNYQAPGRRVGLEKVGVVWALVATGRGLLVMIGPRPMIDVAWSAGQCAALQPSVEPGGKLLIAFDPHLFNPATSGEVEVRAKSSRAQEWVNLIRSHQRS